MSQAYHVTGCGGCGHVVSQVCHVTGWWLLVVVVVAMLCCGPATSPGSGGSEGDGGVVFGVSSK